MGRRRRNQDTTQIGDIDHAIDSQDNQLQSLPVSAETLNNPTENKSSIRQTEEIPYDERPIPEAYFPPEDETTPEVAPVSVTPQQTTVAPVVKIKTVSDNELDALSFPAKTVVSKVEEPQKEDAKTVTKENTVSTKSIDLTALQFELKQNSSANQSTATATPATSVETPHSDVSAPIVHDTVASASTSTTDSLLAQKDSIAGDSLAKDSIAFIPVETPEPKRDIISIDGKEMPNTINNTWWYHPLLFVLLIAHIIIIGDRKKAILSEMESFIKPNTNGSIFGFQWLQNSKYKFFLSVLSVISVILYLFQASGRPLSAAWIFIVAVTIFIVGKKIILALLEYIYLEGADIVSMSNAFMVMVRSCGLMLIPSVLGLSFSPEPYRNFFVYWGIFVVGIALLAFNLKIIINFSRGIISIFYLILYLCTLEVIPVVIFFALGLLPKV